MDGEACARHDGCTAVLMGRHQGRLVSQLKSARCRPPADLVGPGKNMEPQMNADKRK
jgi:hypothetical protein